MINLKILIDADGCPVTRLAVNTAKEYNIESVIFCDTSHIFKNIDTKIVTVSQGADSADFALVNTVEKNDIVVTQDNGLAAMALAKGAFVLNQNGMIINDFNISLLLETRHQSKKMRQSKKHLKGPKRRCDQNDIDFENALRRIINENIDCT